MFLKDVSYAHQGCIFDKKIDFNVNNYFQF